MKKGKRNKERILDSNFLNNILDEMERKEIEERIVELAIQKFHDDWKKLHRRKKNDARRERPHTLIV